jgi:hypothetical protein
MKMLSQKLKAKRTKSKGVQGKALFFSFTLLCSLKKLRLNVSTAISFLVRFLKIKAMRTKSKGV